MGEKEARESLERQFQHMDLKKYLEISFPEIHVDIWGRAKILRYLINTGYDFATHDDLYDPVLNFLANIPEYVSGLKNALDERQNCDKRLANLALYQGAYP